MKHNETIFAGEKVSIENTQSSALSISIDCKDGCQLDLDLMPGQIIGFSAGDLDAKVVLRSGDPAGLLLIRPESAS